MIWYRRFHDDVPSRVILARHTNWILQYGERHALSHLHRWPARRIPTPADPARPFPVQAREDSPANAIGRDYQFPPSVPREELRLCNSVLCPHRHPAGGKWPCCERCVLSTRHSGRPIRLKASASRARKARVCFAMFPGPLRTSARSAA